MLNVFDVRSLFENQFKPDGDGFLYRKYSKSAPVRVSAAERDRYIAAFRRFYNFGMLSIAIGTMLLISLFVGYGVLSNTEPSAVGPYLFAGFGVMLAIYMYFYFRAWNFPSRELCDRIPVGEARSRAEIRARMAANMGYGQIALLLAIGIALPASLIRRYGLYSIWGIGALAYCAFVTISVALLVVRKLRLSSRNNA